MLPTHVQHNMPLGECYREERERWMGEVEDEKKGAFYFMGIDGQDGTTGTTVA